MKTTESTRAWVQRYLGTNKPTFCTKSADIKKQSSVIIKNFHSESEFYKYIDLQYSTGKTFEDLAIGASVFGKGVKYRQNFNPAYLDKWLNYTVGWAEVDSLCQSNFTADDLLSNWSTWKQQLIKFSLDKNIHKRRASLVLLCKPLRLSSDSHLSDLAIELVNRLKSEKEILITKAISWILRSMVKNCPDLVKKYLENNHDSLPKIAYRETFKKLTTGKKN